MAQKQIVQLVDDLDGRELKDGQGETVVFGLDGIGYEIDLSTKNAKALRDAFGAYVDAGRKVTGSRTPRRSRGTGVDAVAVRKWAESNGVEVSPRGRISAEVVEKYKAAGN